MFKSISRLVKWTGPYKRRLYAGYFFSFFSSAFTVMPIMLAVYALDWVIADWKNQQELDINQVWLTAGLMVLLVLGRFLFSYLRAVTQDSIAYEQIAQERIRVGDILKRVSLGFFDKTSTGEISAAVTTDLSFMEMYATSMLDSIIRGYIMAAVIVLCMLFYSPMIGVISMVGIGVSACFLHLLANRSKANAPVHQKAQDTMISAVLEYVRGIALVKAFKYQGAAAKGVQDSFAEHRRINIKIEKEYVIFNALHLYSLKLASAGIVLVSSFQAYNGKISLPVMLMMLMFSFVIYGNIESINNATHVLKVIDAAMDKMDKIKAAEFIDESSQDIEVQKHDIQFDQVSFGYDSKMVIDHVSFFVPEKSVTAIVGPSGGGKTTLTSLMVRFYDADQGAVTLGGQDIRGMTCDSLLKNYSMVFQKVYLFRDTIENNIRFGCPEAGFVDVQKAARKASCHDFIMQLPNQYQTVIGDGGSTLSGGERQRISIARAMLKDAPVVILDEATASIDPENEFAIQEAVNNLVKNKTLIIIAHRLATIRSADQILVVNGGKIEEQGRHEELLARGGTYKRFWDIRQQAENWQI